MAAKRRTAVTLLRVATFGTIAMGVLALVGGLLTGQIVHTFGMPVPAWGLGAMVSFVGVRYWLRLRDLEKNIALNG
jgi:hypothetical protein